MTAAARSRATARPPVTRERIGEVALRILDEAEDESALTMRTLAAELGVKAPSLYAHVDGIHDVLGLVHGRINGLIDLSTVDHPDPHEGLRRFAHSYRRAYGQHRVAAAIIVTRSVNADHALVVYEAAAACLSRAGVPLGAVMPCLAMLDYIALGSAVEPFAAGFAEPTRSYRASYPVLAEALARSQRRHLDDEGFEIGLEAFIDVVRAAAA